MWWFRKREKIHFDYTHDIHSHVLPGVDDGVRTYGEAIMVLKGLSRLGVKRVTCTSHVYFPALMNGRENLHPLLEDLRAGLQKEGVEIELDLGAEYRVGEYMLSLIERGEILSGEDGTVYTPEMVLGPARRGIKMTYCTDTRPTESIVAAAEGSDLFICEGMYAEPEKLVKAKQYKHMTFYEAADMAKRAGVREMWLTHYSPSLVHAENYLPQVREIFPDAFLGKDGKSVELMFEDEN